MLALLSDVNKRVDGTYVNRHVEVVGLEVVGHLAEALERVLAHGLLEAERLARLAALLCDGRSAHHREAFATAGVCVCVC